MSWKVRLKPSEVLAKVEWKAHPELDPEQQGELAIERRALVGIMVRNENRSRFGTGHADKDGNPSPGEEQKYNDRDLQPEVEANIKHLIGEEGLREDSRAADKALNDVLSAEIAKTESRRNWLKGAAAVVVGGGLVATRMAGCDPVGKTHKAMEDLRKSNKKDPGQQEGQSR